MPTNAKTTNAKTLRKQNAQDALLDALSSAYYSIADNPSLDNADKDFLLQDLDVQRHRIEKLFGYEARQERPW
tara:strand:+ start:218 stop:436 length:219 start_codon:yes stop_codon:yes gene_type:complete